jgi:hypothetical protein
MKKRPTCESIVEMIDELCLEGGDDILIPDGLEAAFVGLDLDSATHSPRAVFSREVAIEELMRTNHWSYEDAVEYFEANVSCAYVGPHTPLWITTKTCIETK